MHSCTQIINPAFEPIWRWRSSTAAKQSKKEQLCSMTCGREKLQGKNLIDFMLLDWKRVPFHSRTEGGEEMHPLKLFGQRGGGVVTPCNDIIWRTQTTWTRHLNKQRVVHLPQWFQNRVWPPPTGWKNTGWFISHHDFGMGCDPPSFLFHRLKKFIP